MELTILILAAAIVSAFLNGAETVFTAFDRILAAGWVRGRKWGSWATHFFTSQPDRFLSTTLIGNSTAQVSLSFLVVLWAERSGIREGWVVVLTPLIVLVFCELIPKTVSYAVANRTVRIV